jgi:hypothetical protein
MFVAHPVAAPVYSLGIVVRILLLLEVDPLQYPSPGTDDHEMLYPSCCLLQRTASACLLTLPR